MVHQARLHEFACQQVEAPGLASGGRPRAHQGNQVRLGCSIEPALLAVELLGPAHALDPSTLAEASPHVGHRVHAHSRHRGDGGVVLAVGGSQQDARALALQPATLVGTRGPLQAQAFFFAEGDDVLFGWHNQHLITKLYLDEALEHMPRRCIALGEWADSADVSSGKFAFRKGEILFGKLRPYFHKVGIAPLDGICSTDILVVTPKSPEWFGFLLAHMSSDALIEFTDLASTGTKMPRTNWTDISAFKVVLPPRPVAATFTSLVLPMIERIISNLHQSRTLAGLRDTLLPKLLSGEVTVP